MKRYFFLIILLTFIILSTGCATIQITEAEDGILDLSNKAFDDNTIYKMRGDWKLSWGEFVDPSETLNHSNSLIKLPQSWSEKDLDGMFLDSQGFGSLILDVDTNLSNIDLAIKSTYITSAFDVYVNGEKIFSNGEVGQTAESTTAMWHPEMGYFHLDDKTAHIVIHFSNFNHPRFVVKDLYIGSKKAIENSKNSRLYIDLIVFGLIFIIGLYHLTLYIMRPKDKISLSFSILCFLFSLRTIIVGDRFIYEIFPQIPWEIFMKLAYFSFYGITISLVYFIHRAFSTDKIKLFEKLLLIIGFVFTIATLLLPAQIFDYLLLPFEIVLFSNLIRLFFILLRAVKNYKIGAKLMIVSLITFILATANDALYENGLINTTSLTQFSLVLLLLSQTYILAKRMTLSYIHAEHLATENVRISEILREQNNSLEDKIQKRTNEISEINKELNSSNKELVTLISAVNESEAKFKSLFENVPIGIFRYSSKYGFQISNPQMIETLNFNSSEELVKALNSKKYTLFSDQDQFDIFMRNLIKQNQINTPIKFQAELIRKDNSLITAEITYQIVNKTSDEILIEGTILDISQRIEVEKKLNFLATTDNLTKLPNRHVFSKRMNQIKTNDYLAIIDIDNFKYINDTYGHDVGDLVLIHISNFLISISNSQVFVSRIGGEEFAIIFSSMSKSEIEILTINILNTINSSAVSYTENESLHYSISMGISKALKNINSAQLFKYADNALYDAKTNGKNQIKYINIS